MKDRHYREVLLMMVGLLLGGMAYSPPALAQDVDPYHAFILEFLSTNYGIEGGEFLIGSDSNVKLDQTSYGTGTVKSRMGPDPNIGYEFVHTENIVQTNPWDSGITWPSTTPVEAGDTGLAVALIRGETTAGGPAVVNIFVERAGGDFFKYMNQDSYQLTSDWDLVAFPFTWTEAFAPGGTQFGLHLSHEEQFVDITAPVVLNYGDAYTPEVLQGMIETGGATPTIARITASATSGPPPFEVTFDALQSTSGGTITGWEWDFGDSNTGSGETVTHTFTDQGTYEVSLTVTADDGLQGTDTQIITVTPLEGSVVQPLEVQFAEAPPAVDGERDAVWDNAQTVSITSLVNGTAPADETDLSGTASLLWDHSNLYVFYEVNDEALFNNSDASWEDDAVDFYVDPGNEKAGTYDLTEDLQHEYSWDTTNVTGKGPMAGQPDGVYAFVTTETGYTVEAALPWDSLGVEPTNDVMFGTEFMINDDDDPSDAGTRQTKLAWFGFVDNAYQFPYLFGNAVLVGEVVAAEPGSELPEAFAIESVYPNPFNPSTTLAVQLRELGDYTVRAYNVLGQKVLERDFTATAVGRNELTMSFGNMPSGLYTVSVQHKVSGRAVSTTAVLLK